MGTSFTRARQVLQTQIAQGTATVLEAILQDRGTGIQARGVISRMGTDSQLEGHVTDQQQVYNAVAERGYTEGWTDEQFVGRQVAKLLEEGAEVAECLRRELVTTPFFVILARGAGLAAREAFDNNGETWDTAHITDPDKMIGELADVLVVLFCAAEGLSRMTGRKFDIVELAKRKALADVERGVR